MPTEELYRIAVLIDAENVDPAYAEQIFTYAHSLGYVAIREIYGSGISLNDWAEPILTNSIHTNFTLKPNRFKNSSDICLVIGAMEILAASRTNDARKIDAIVLASSDSDFSPLAVHLRSENIDVIGMGEPGHINPMWPKACTDFIPLETNKPLTRNRESGASVPVSAPAAIPAAGAAADMPPASPVPAAPAADQLRPAPEIVPEPPMQPVQKEETPAEEKRKTPPKKKTAKTEEKKKPEEKKEKKPAIAPTHRARIEIIRRFIIEQIEKHEGRVASRELFRSLAELPDYKYDQRRSRRNPLDYLKTQYSEWLQFEPGKEGIAWIRLKDAAESENALKPVIGISEEEIPSELTEGTDDLPDDESPEENDTETAIEPESASNPETTGASGEEPDPISRLAAAGIPAQHIDRVAEILSGCRNLRDSYNHLRKAFGNETGKTYQEIIKKVPFLIGTAG